MRLLGIDYGEKKIGVAISDESGKFAFPFAVVDNKSASRVLNEIKKIIDGKEVVKIVLGQSLTFKLQPNPIMKRIDKFKSFLEERLNIPVEYENEILTTKQAERTMSKDEKIHASAAALILQSHLDRNKNKKETD